MACRLKAALQLSQKRGAATGIAKSSSGALASPTASPSGRTTASPQQAGSSNLHPAPLEATASMGVSSSRLSNSVSAAKRLFTQGSLQRQTSQAASGAATGAAPESPARAIAAARGSLKPRDGSASPVSNASAAAAAASSPFNRPSDSPQKASNHEMSHGMSRDLSPSAVRQAWKHLESQSSMKSDASSVSPISKHGSGSLGVRALAGALEPATQPNQHARPNASPSSRLNGPSAGMEAVSMEAAALGSSPRSPGVPAVKQEPPLQQLLQQKQTEGTAEKQTGESAAASLQMQALDNSSSNNSSDGHNDEEIESGATGPEADSDGMKEALGAGSQPGSTPIGSTDANERMEYSSIAASTLQANTIAVCRVFMVLS